MSGFLSKSNLSPFLFLLILLFSSSLFLSLMSCSIIQRKPPEVNLPTNPNASGNAPVREGSSLNQEIVAKTQYDELLMKHNDLLKKAKERGVVLEDDSLGLSGASGASGTRDRMVNSNKTEAQNESKVENNQDRINYQSDVKMGVSSLIEGVGSSKNDTYNAAKDTKDTKDTKDEIKNGDMDAGGEKLALHASSKNVSPSTSSLSSSEDAKLENEIAELTRALEVLGKRQYGSAMKILQNVENSKFKQVKVRAKFYIGEILLLQKEYDLAMQSYDEIINKYAYSSVTLRALERGALCAKKLSLKDKYERYNSLIRIFN
ncbi:MAG: hypothetical protein HQK49_03155 [Oligoflexia bacterium]|nr:hypothetical protein [Oligoflexia bacterium]